MSEDISNSKSKHRQDVRASRSTKNHMTGLGYKKNSDQEVF